MIYIDQNNDLYNNDFRSMIQAFFINEKIVACGPEDMQEGDAPRFVMQIRYDDSGILFRIQEYAAGDMTAKEEEFVACDYRDKQRYKDEIHGGIYRVLSRYTGRTLPWGFLTGVRPTKLALTMLERGESEQAVHHYFEDICYATKQKADISIEVAKREHSLISGIDFRNAYCLYIGIPFCPSRCLYCSFASYPIASYEDKVDTYLDTLEREMQFGAEAYRNRQLISVYIGGGTPTSISAAQLDRLLTGIGRHFDMSAVREFTVEAGRPDSITEDKLCVLLRHGIRRISINPQTMHDETLKLIGRAHTVEQTFSAFHLARRLGFDNINMDMIAGLPGEDVSHVKETLAALRTLAPESLTVHSLAIKRAAELNIGMQKYRSMLKGSSDEMLLAVDGVARELNLLPYYLYRQKNIPGNLENIGYAAEGRECLYNILIMEEKMDILALGAGATTKVVFHDENRIERAENVKNVDVYIGKIDEMIERKKRLLPVT